MVHYGEVWPQGKGKMLDPSGCFYYTIPCIAVLYLAQIRTEISTSGREYDGEQSIPQINAKSAHAQKL